MKKKMLSLVLVLAMSLTLLPISALAAAHPVTKNQITLSNVIVSNEYDNMYDILETGNDADKAFYSPGIIGFWSEDDKMWGYKDFWTYFLPTDATITFHLTEDTKNFYLEGYTLKEAKSILPGIKTWHATFSGADEGTSEIAQDFTMKFSDIKEYIPEFDFLACSVDGKNWIEITFPEQSSGNSTSAVSTQDNPSFTDVAATSPFAPAIAWAVEQGITSGKTSSTFAPSENCTHGQILTFLWRSQGSPDASTVVNTIGDKVSKDAYYYQAVLWALHKGLFGSKTEVENFDPNRTCTRGSAMCYLWRLAGWPNMETKNAFTDIVDTQVKQAAAWGVANGVTSGTSATTFSPNSVCTRGQIVTFLYRAYAK